MAISVSFSNLRLSDSLSTRGSLAFIQERCSVKNLIERVRADGGWSIFDTLPVVPKEGEDGVYEVISADGELVMHASKLLSEAEVKINPNLHTIKCIVAEESSAEGRRELMLKGCGIARTRSITTVSDDIALAKSVMCGLDRPIVKEESCAKYIANVQTPNPTAEDVKYWVHVLKFGKCLKEEALDLLAHLEDMSVSLICVHV